VLIAPGMYRHAISPLCSGVKNQRITFRMHGDGEAIVDGAGVVAPLVLLNAKHYVTVDGLTFANLPREGHPGVVRGDVSRGLEVLNCRVGYYKRHSGFGRGIMLYRCPDARVEGNLIWGTRYHCDLNQCPNTLVRNNTFAYGQVFSTYFHGDHRGCRFVNNIFFRATSVPNAALAISFATKDIRLTSDYNCFGPMVARTHVAFVYRGYVTNVLVPGPTLEQWQKNSGQDRHSIQANPMFVNPGAGDFRLKPNSPAIGAGEGGVNMGACGVATLGIRGRSSLLPGEGRTIRMTARPAGPASGRTAFEWELPRGEKRQGAVLEYTPPDDVNRFELKLNATDARGRVTRAQVDVSVPPPELAQPRDDMIRIEGEDFVAQGGGEVRFYQPVNASGKSFSHWNRSVGHWLEWELAVPSNGEYVIYARYTTNLRGRSRSLTIDGATPSPAYEKIAFPCTGGWSLTEDNWAFKKLGPTVTLTAGKHRLRMTNLDSAVNVDYFVLVPVPRNP